MLSPVFALVVVVVAALAVYTNSLENGFVWDDAEIVVENPATTDPARLPEVVLTPDETAPYYRPLNRASYVLDHALFGMRPAGFHAVNIGLHAATTALLFLLVLALSGSVVAAAVAASLHAVHPVNAEAVNFITARNNLFAALFVLASVLALLRAGRSPRAGAWRWGCGALLFLGLASKEQALMALPLLIALAFAGESTDRGRVLAPLGLALGAYLAARWVALGSAVGASSILPGLGARLMANIVSIPKVVSLLLVPRSLTVFHEEPTNAGAAIGPLLVAWIALAIVAVVVVRSRRRLSLFGLAWLALNLIPLSGIVPIPSATIAERYLYVPAIGAWILAGDAAAAAVERLHDRRGRSAAAVLALAVLAALAARTVARNRDWRDDVSLFASAARVAPRDPRPHYNLGVALKDRGDLDGARRAWETAITLDDADADSLTQLGTLAAVGGDLERAEAFFRRALRSRPDQAMAHYNLALICESTGRVEEAMGHFATMVELRPEGYGSYVATAEERLARLRSARPSRP